MMPVVSILAEKLYIWKRLFWRFKLIVILNEVLPVSHSINTTSPVAWPLCWMNLAGKPSNLERSNFNSPTSIRSNTTLLMYKHPNTLPNGQPQSEQSTLHSSTSTNYPLTSSSLASSWEQYYIRTVYQTQWLRLLLGTIQEGALHPTLLMGISLSCVSRWDSSLVAPRKSERSIHWSPWGY